MKKIILTVLSATLLLATTATTKNETQETSTKSRDAVLIEKQALRTSKIEAAIAKKELARVAKEKMREEKIEKLHTHLKEKATARAQA